MLRMFQVLRYSWQNEISKELIKLSEKKKFKTINMKSARKLFQLWQRKIFSIQNLSKFVKSEVYCKVCKFCLLVKTHQ